MPLSPRTRDRIVDTISETLPLFTNASDEARLQAVTYLDGEGDENELVRQHLIRLARTNTNTRDLLKVLSQEPNGSVGKTRAVRILSAVTA